MALDSSTSSLKKLGRLMVGASVIEREMFLILKGAMSWYVFAAWLM